MIDRTLQNKMEVEKAEMERTWSANGRRVVALQNRMVKLGEEIKNEKVIMKTNFKSKKTSSKRNRRMTCLTSKRKQKKGSWPKQRRRVRKNDLYSSLQRR